MAVPRQFALGASPWLAHRELALGRPMRWFAKPQLSTRAALWQALSRDAGHPIARHLRRQLGSGSSSRADSASWQPTILPFCLICGLLALAAFARAYSSLGPASIWTLPLWLMLFSLSYCAVWIARIVNQLARLASDGSLDALGVTPLGPAFVYLVACRLVINAGDALAWLTFLRRALAGVVLLVLVMALCIAATQIRELNALELVSLLLALALLGLVIPLEHEQSVILALLTALVIGARPQSHIDRASAALAAFTLLQIMSFALALALVIALDALELSLALALYLLIRELLIVALWKLLLRQLNEDSFLALGSQGTAYPSTVMRAGISSGDEPDV